jgi:peptidoglycan/LPS O-acetylase OafA/YrhL
LKLLEEKRRQERDFTEVRMVAAPLVQSFPPEIKSTVALDNRSKLHHIPALDAVRGLAILMVIVLHYSNVASAPNALERWGVTLLHNGWIGVDIFFALSGFLITRILLNSREDQKYFSNFYMRRALRIFPLYYGVLAVLFVICPMVMANPPASEIASRQWWLWAYTANIKDAIGPQLSFKAHGVYLDHFWSLAVEEQFYLFWPLVVFLFRRKTLGMICVSMLGIPLAIRIALVCAHAHPDKLYLLTVCRLDTLAAGAMLALTFDRPAARAFISRWSPPVACVTLALLLAFSLTHRSNMSFYFPSFELFGYPILTLFAAAVIGSFISEQPCRVVATIGRSRVLKVFGAYSYGMYVLHYLLIPAVDAVAPATKLQASLHSFALGLAAYILLGLSVSFILAFVSFHAFEKHFLKLKRFFASDRARHSRPIAYAEVGGDAVIPEPALAVVA